MVAPPFLLPAFRTNVTNSSELIVVGSSCFAVLLVGTRPSIHQIFGRIREGPTARQGVHPPMGLCLVLLAEWSRYQFVFLVFIILRIFLLPHLLHHHLWLSKSSSMKTESDHLFNLFVGIDMASHPLDSAHGKFIPIGFGSEPNFSSCISFRGFPLTWCLVASESRHTGKHDHGPRH
jgi:hypothetical protein